MLNVGYVGYSHSDCLQLLDDWLTDQGYGRMTELTDEDVPWGGHKMPETSLYGGAFNYLDHDAMLIQIASLPWEYPDEVQLMVMEQEAYVFRVWNLQTDHTWRELQ